MKADPLVAIEGQENLDSGRAQNRGQQMKAEHDQVMEESGVATDKKVSDYVYALNGFAANVTYTEAVQLAEHKNVAFVLPDELQQATTDSSPTFLPSTGRTAPGRPESPAKGLSWA